MIKRDWTLLFSKYDLGGNLRGQLASIDDRVRKVPSTRFDEASDELISATVASGLVVSPIVLLEDQIEVSTKDAKIDVSHDFNRVHNSFGPTIVNGIEVTYHLPYAGDGNLFQCQPSSFSYNPPRAVIARKELHFPYDQPDRDVAATKQRFSEDLKSITEWLGWVNADVDKYNLAVEPAVRSAVRGRRAELARTRTDLEALGYGARSAGPAKTAAPVAESHDETVARRSAIRKNAKRGFDVALSFAGEDRTYVEDVAGRLVAAGVTVFYDRYEQANLWGADLASHLGAVYGKDARFVVLFLSRHYAAKAWPNHEKSFALGRHLKGDTGRMLPVRFDDTEIAGLPPTLGYLDLRVIGPDQLVELIRQKIDVSAGDA